MSVVRLAGLLVLLCAAATWSACDRCSFRLVSRLQVRDTVGCCGASARHDVSVPDGASREVDLANTGFNAAVGNLDLWLVRADCDQLFDGAYPGSTQKCPALIGPVAAGAVSSRIKLGAGNYRVFVQLEPTNPTPLEYVGDVGVWGTDCTPVSPTRP